MTDASAQLPRKRTATCCTQTLDCPLACAEDGSQVQVRAARGPTKHTRAQATALVCSKANCDVGGK